MAGRVGPLATQSREIGQARKGAAAAADVCAGVWLAGFAAQFRLSPPVAPMLAPEHAPGLGRPVGPTDRVPWGKKAARCFRRVVVDGVALEQRRDAE